jgi:polar amino acid transport system substrate-binding protein
MGTAGEIFMRALLGLAVLFLGVADSSAEDLPDLGGRGVIAMIDERLPGKTRYEKGDRSSFEHAALDEIAKRLNLDIEWKRTDTEAMVPALVNGAGDIAIDRLPVDAPRDGRVVLTEPYLVLDQVVLVRAESVAVDATDPSLVVGAVKGASTRTAVSRLLDNDPNSKRLVTFERDSEAAAAVLRGSVHIAVVDHLTAEKFIEEPGNRLVQLGEPIGSESFAFALAEGSDLADALNAGLVSLRKDGTMRAYTLGWMSVWD